MKSRCAKPWAWMAGLMLLVACDDYSVSLSIRDCAQDACVRPPSGRQAQFVVETRAPSEDGVVARINGLFAERIDRSSGGNWLITARQSWAELGDSVHIYVKGYSDCKIRCDRWQTSFELIYAEKSWQTEGVPMPIAPDAFAVPTTDGHTVLVQREASGTDGETNWEIVGEYNYRVYPGAPWPMFVDSFGRPGVLDPDAFGRTQSTALSRTALPQGTVLGRLDEAIYVRQDDTLLRVTESDTQQLGPAEDTDTVLAAQDSLWWVLRGGEPGEEVARLQHMENGSQIQLPDGPQPYMEILRGPAHALVYERVVRTDNAFKPYGWQRYALNGDTFELVADVRGYMATMVPQGLGVIESDFAAQAGRTDFGFAVGGDWIWLADGVASLVRSNYWHATQQANWDDKVRDW